MRESGGGAAGRTLDGYKKYVDEIQSSNDEFGYNEEILSEEDWNLENQIDPYTGGMEEKGIRSTHWRAGGPTAIDQMFDKKDLFPINTKAASDPIYPWMKSRSIKGDDFAKNLNEIDPGLNVTLRPSVTEPPWSDEEHYNSLSEEEQIAADEAYVSSLNDEKVGSLRTNTMLTNRQLVPFLLEDMMMNTLDWKGRSATENSPRIPGIIDKHPDAYRLGSDFDNPEGLSLIHI